VSADVSVFVIATGRAQKMQAAGAGCPGAGPPARGPGDTFTEIVLRFNFYAANGHTYCY